MMYENELHFIVATHGRTAEKWHPQRMAVIDNVLIK